MCSSVEWIGGSLRSAAGLYLGLSLGLAGCHPLTSGPGFQTGERQHQESVSLPPARVTRLEAHLQGLREQREELARTHSDLHPAVQDLDRRIRVLEEQIRLERAAPAQGSGG